MKYIVAIAIGLALCACADPEIQYVEKLVPVKCDIEMPKEPQQTGDIMQDIPNILIYTEVLESDLQFCISGESNKTKGEN